MFVHANALEPNATALANGELSVFIRLGSDYKNNFYEYDIPLSLTPARRYNDRLWADSRAVWPEENMLVVLHHLRLIGVGSAFYSRRKDIVDGRFVAVFFVAYGTNRHPSCL